MPVEDVLVSILGTEKKPVGGGLLTGKDAALTCAHVVNAALGRERLATGRPSGDVLVRLTGSAETVKAVIDPGPDAWKDPPASRPGSGDLCILKLPDGSADAAPTRLRIYANAANRTYRTAGFPRDWKGDLDISKGEILGRDQYGLYLLRPGGTAEPKKTFRDGEQRPAGGIHEGFSGCPVESENVIVGIVVQSRQPSDVTAYMIPVAQFPDRFKPQSEEDRNRVLEAYPHVSLLESRLAEQRLTGRVGGTFDLRLRICESFHDALEAHRTSDTDRQLDYQDGRDLRALEVASMLRARKDHANRDLKNLLLHAPGGGGKSSFLMELLLSAADLDLVPFYLDFSKSGGIGAGADAKSQLKSWFDQFDAFGEVEALLELAKSSGSLRPLLVIDSFNQATRQWRDALDTLTKLSNQALAGASIVVADRMADRGSTTFRHAVIPPLAQSAYWEALPGGTFDTVRDDPAWSAILASPMFLNLLLLLASTGDSGSPAGVPGRMQILNRYFRETCGFTSADLRALADFSYEIYRLHQQTAIPKQDLNTFYAADGASLKERIEEKGLIHDLGQDSEFRHQVLHDALAALKVASTTEREEETLLRAPAFEIVSLRTASEDAIELAVEALQNPSDLLGERLRPLETREFLAAVFDWNYWITLQCVASFDRRRGVSPVPPWFRHAIYAHNLGRRFDPFLHTALRAEQLRLLIPSSPDLTYFDAATRQGFDNAVTEAIRSAAEPDGADEKYKNEWLEAYLWRSPLTVLGLEPLWGDPVLSWTAANGIRRCDIPEEITDELLRIYRISRRTSDSAPKAAMFRWRIAHVLGRGHPGALGELAEITFDPFENPSVRYGAMRSLIELAATRSSTEDRRRVLERIRSGVPELFQAGDLRSLGNLRRELRRCCAFNEPNVEGRQGWLEEWLTEGLEQFGTILHEGATRARQAGLSGEAELWEAWVSATESVRKNDGDWNARRLRWQASLEEDQ